MRQAINYNSLKILFFLAVEFAFEDDEVGADSIEKPVVVADCNGDVCKIQQGV
jgi:hypothetical protein